MTELEAVNRMLTAIGEQEVSSITGSVLAEVAIARSELRIFTEELQSTSWDFNREVDYVLTPTVGNRIIIPQNATFVDSKYHWLKYIKRKEFTTDTHFSLYDQTNRTFEFTENVTVDITFKYNFDDLSFIVQNYITAKASRRFAGKVTVDAALENAAMRHEAEAMALFKEEEGETGDYNMNTGSYTMNSTLSRQAYR